MCAHARQQTQDVLKYEPAAAVKNGLQGRSGPGSLGLLLCFCMEVSTFSPREKQINSQSEGQNDNQPEGVTNSTAYNLKFAKFAKCSEI